MERRKGLFDDEEKEEDEVPLPTKVDKAKGEEEVVTISPKEEEKKDTQKEMSEKIVVVEKDFHEVTLAEKGAQAGILVSSMEDELNMDFMVGNPEDRGGHIQYYVKGKDRLGEWEGSRRYNHFFYLHEILCQRWPGVYLPRLPPKKAIGRYEVKFLQERRYFLERYLRRLGSMDFIVNQEEFIVFSRPNGDIDKVLQRMTKLSCTSIIERLQRHLGINDKLYDISDKELFDNRVQEFYAFSQRVLPQLRELKKKLSDYKDQKQLSNLDFGVLFKTWPVYEEDCVFGYMAGNKEKLILNEAGNNPEMREYIENITENLKNPWEWMYWWVRGEIYDLKALKFAVEQRDQIDKQMKKLKARKAEVESDLQTMLEGKTSMRTVFKSSQDSETVRKEIEIIERDIGNLGVLLDTVTIHLGKDVIPKLKRSKMKIYKQMLSSFSVAEINNAHSIATFWNKIADNKYIMHEVMHGGKNDKK